jgi:CheY-like chemotaxis protein
MKVLVVEQDPIEQQALAQVVAARGGVCIVATGHDQALERFAAESPDLVFLSVEDPAHHALELLTRLRERCRQTIVVITAPRHDAAIAIEALRLHASDYLVKPLRPARLIPLLKKFEGVVNSRAVAAEVEARITARHFTIVLENRLDLVPGVAEYLVANSFLTGHVVDAMGLKLGLVELLNNAIEHGNLGITAAEKEAALASPDGYAPLFNSRLHDPRHAWRKVTITTTTTGDQCEWIIRDEGAGFDWRAHLTQLQTPDVLRLSGRGIFLSRFQFDEIEYLGAGNAVRAVKRFEPLPDELE